MPDVNAEKDRSPMEPRYLPVKKIARKLYDFMASSKLAMVLLIVILACCLVGVTAYRGERAWTVIFNTLWFSGILVLLVVNVAFCFFGRLWGRKLTIVSLGMILFHLSFVAMLGGIIYNNLFYFHGMIRLTEGETLPSSDPGSYDKAEGGRYFSFNKLKGDTTLIRMHKDYTVAGDDKMAAYEISVGEGDLKKQGVIYVTHSLDNNGFSYFNDREGHSLLVILYDKQGRELYGAHVPLQSLKQKNDAYLYTTGTKNGPGALPFPQKPLQPLFNLQASYVPDKKMDRTGEVEWKLWPLTQEDTHQSKKLIAVDKAMLGRRIKVGEYYLLAKEARYWVVMSVRYDPGKPVVLLSLWIGLSGMIITFFGRMGKKGP